MKKQFLKLMLCFAFVIGGAFSVVNANETSIDAGGEDCSRNGFRTIESTIFGGTWAMLCNCSTHKGNVGSECR